MHREEKPTGAIVEAAIRKAGQAAIDELIDGWSEHWTNDDRCDYLSRIVDACVSTALSAAISEQTLPVRVKALEWTSEENGDFTAQSVIGWYHIGLPHRTWNLTMPHGEVPSFATLEAAKAAAQADYEQRIRSALVDVPAVESEPVAWMHPTAHWASTKRENVRAHCRNNGPQPIPLYAAPVRSAIVPAQDEADRWLPIDTAPKDGTSIDLWGVNHLHHAKTGRRATNVTWGRVRDWMGNERDDWQHGQGEDFEPTHWRPVPAPPLSPRTVSTSEEQNAPLYHSREDGIAASATVSKGQADAGN